MAPGSKPSGLKMKELVEATGVAKSTILHYINQGLLPRPVKTSPNMARYHPDMIERIGFIKQMQQKHRLPLASIKKLLTARDQGGDPAQLVALQETLFGKDQGALTRAQLLKRSGMEPEHLQKCLEAGLIIPLDPESFDQEDLAMARLCKAMSGYGVEPDDAAYYRRLAEEMVDHEMALRSRLTGHLPEGDDAAITIRMTQAARAMRAYVIDRVFLRRVMAMADLKDKGTTK